MAKLGRVHVMLAQEMVDRSVSVRQVATQVGGRSLRPRTLGSRTPRRSIVRLPIEGS